MSVSAIIRRTCRCDARQHMRVTPSVAGICYYYYGCIFHFCDMSSSWSWPNNPIIEKKTGWVTRESVTGAASSHYWEGHMSTPVKL